MPVQSSLTPIGDEDFDEQALSKVFFALSDPVRRAILERLGDGPALVSEIAAPFEISLQAVSKHIQVLVRAGLVSQARSGRIAKCSLDIGPVFAAALWLNRYTEYWQAQFDALTVALGEIERTDAHETKTSPAAHDGVGERTRQVTPGARRKALGLNARSLGKSRKTKQSQKASRKRTHS